MTSSYAGAAQPKVWVIVLCYNGVELTLACLRSLRQITYPNAEILIVDNASQDETVAKINAAFPDVCVIETGANLGFAEGNNVGLRYAKAQGADYVLLLNNDTEVAPDFLDQLVGLAESDASIGAVGPKMYYFDYPKRIYSTGGEIDWVSARTAMRGIDQEDHSQFEQVATVDFVSGCAILVRQAAIDAAGLLDPRFFMYYEEVEWCVRITRAKWRILYAPKSVIWHKINPAQQDLSPRIGYYMARNRLLFLKATRAPALTWFRAMIVQDLRTWIMWGVRPKWANRGQQRAALARAYRDFFGGRFGMAEQVT